MKQLILRIKRRESPFYDFLYRVGRKGRSFSVPTLPVIHGFLYHEWNLRTSVWHDFWRIFYYEPMFKSQCKAVGSNFRMEFAGNGSAKIIGSLNLSIGDHVTMFDNTMFVGLKVLDNPELIIEDHTYIGPLVRFMVGSRISIGKHCMITSRIVTDNQGHPIDDVLARMTCGGGAPSADKIRPVTIGDFCFLPLDTVIYPGVNIGDGVVARIGTHINRDAPPFCQVVGNPMKVVKKLPIPEQLRQIVGRERFESYLKAHDALNI